MVLGDGCIPPSRKGEKYFTFACKKADEEYFQYKVEILQTLNKVNVREENRQLGDKFYPTLVASTLSHPVYTKLFDHMYHNGRKTVDEHAMKCLSEQGLALWYFDDGTLAGEMGFRNPYICSHNFNKLENEYLCMMIQKKFGIIFRTVAKNVKEKTYYWMRLRRKDRDRFFEIVSPFAPKCMERKINPEFHESDEKYFSTETRTCDCCEESFEVKSSSVAKRCESCLNEKLRDNHREYYDGLRESRKEICVQCESSFIRKPGKNTKHCSRDCSGKTHSNYWKTRSDQVKT